MAIVAAPVSRAAIRPRVVTVETGPLVGTLMDCQILAGYADQAMAAAGCPCSAAPVSVARSALGKLQALLRAETGRLEGIA